VNSPLNIRVPGVNHYYLVQCFLGSASVKEAQFSCELIRAWVTPMEASTAALC